MRGSPPRVRGKLYGGYPERISARITPACAGKTGEVGYVEKANKDHPRGCGENARTMPPQTAVPGSPPRVRGKRVIQLLKIWQQRITPACAGKTPHIAPLEASGQDHPRVCGENPAARPRRLRPRGSPPRVRGKPFSVSSVRASGRITPACAGKTASPHHAAVPHGDHPRVCGENTPLGGNMITMPGSPPRVRGKQVAFLVSHRFDRITPACAGKTTNEQYNISPV